MMWLLLSLLTGTAGAQDVEAPPLNAQLYRTPIDARLTLMADDSSWAPGSYVMGRLVLNYMQDPLVWQYDDGEIVDVLGQAVQANAVAGVSLGRVRVGVDVPVTLAAISDVSTGGAGLGDIAIDVKGNALDRGKWGTGLAFGARLSAPTNTVDAPLGGNPHGEFQVIADRRIGNGFVAGNLGGRVSAFTGQRTTQWLFRPFVRGGAGFIFNNETGVSFDVAGYGSQTFPLDEPSGSPVEYIAGGWYRAGDSVVMRAGLGRGLTRGVGAPRARLILSLGWEPPREQDSDLDGIMDRIDECPFDPEDRDEFEDQDGCAELDNDDDSIKDAFDACTMEPEDVDGFEDSDGCPEPQTEAHLRVNAPDGTLVEAAKITVTGAGITPKWGGGDYRVVLDPGSYTMTAEADGFKPFESTILIEEFKSFERIGTLTLDDPKGTLVVTVLGGHGREIHGAQVAEDAGPFEALDDELSLEAGPWRKLVRAPGFGTTELLARVGIGEATTAEVVLPEPRVEVGVDAIVLSEGVIFLVDGTELDAASHRLLDDLAGALLDDEELKPTITGFPDAAGETDELMALGQKRAKAVKDYLTQRGVAGSRVTIAGGVGEGGAAPSNAITVSLQTSDE